MTAHSAWLRAKSWLRHHNETSPVLAAVLTLMSGTGIAQVITFILQIFIARIYSDFDKGLFGIYGTITSFIITFAALRFDLTIVLPKEGISARVLKKLATRCVVVSSILTSTFCIIFSKWLENNYHHSAALSKWLMISGITVFIVAETTNVQYWLIRQERFGAIALNTIVKSLSTAGMQLMLGIILKGGLTGLIIGTMAGQLITLILISLKAPDLRKKIPDTAPGMLAVAKRYKNMPLLNAPNVLVDSIRTAGINLLIGAASIAALGQFQLAWAIMEVPVGLIAGSISQVFLKKLSAAEPGEMYPLVKSTLIRVALVALIPFLILFIAAPWLFPFLFGARWEPAGHFGRALTPWLYMTVLTSPISNIFVVTENQRRMLIFAIFYCIVPLSWLFFANMDLLPTIFILGGLMAAMLLIMIALAIWCAREFDARQPMNS